MKKRKKGIVLGLVAAFLLLLVFGGVELYRYNTLSYKIGSAPGQTEGSPFLL